MVEDSPAVRAAKRRIQRASETGGSSDVERGIHGLAFRGERRFPFRRQFPGCTGKQGGTFGDDRPREPDAEHGGERRAADRNRRAVFIFDVPGDDAGRDDGIERRPLFLCRAAVHHDRDITAQPLEGIERIMPAQLDHCPVVRRAFREVEGDGPLRIDAISHFGGPS